MKRVLIKIIISRPGRWAAYPFVALYGLIVGLLNFPGNAVKETKRQQQAILAEEDRLNRIRNPHRYRYRKPD